MTMSVAWREETTQIGEVLRQSEKVLILEHEKPDGDSIGAGLGLVLGMLFLGKNAILLSQDPHPSTYDFLPGRHLHIVVSDMKSEYGPFDAVVFLDCADRARAGAAVEFAKGDIVINIDHHVTNSMFGDINLVDPGASSTSELVFYLLKTMQVPITRNIAICLYTGIISDTGAFRYENTTSRTFAVASHLVDAGADPSRIANQLYECRTASFLLLLGKALQTLSLHHDGKVASVEITREMIRDAGSSFQETDGIVDYPRSIEGVEVALCFKERPDGIGVDVSFRSKCRVDVSKIAEALGGGGHPRAAGATITGSMEEAKDKVFSLLSKEQI
ncbi:MAG TPA: bifunctional oligoribonuclease/PAP phosphatase NrnA [Bacillota bacterium]|nr:bifunctional oligoribonuclease/PAP phosphatase NrnA [Bacillota bacterium]HPZ78129.1 bifunctional oligoribonuclease/PAP phosphatase NrnA [Bacillota bacterium]HQD74367.1 bifunctional oligoribonuclease/PAP phosphatase NrnA [Bacillota bacterium]